MDFATLHREWRTARGFSLGALARRAGVSKATLSYWESGARRPSMAELEGVLDVLGVGPEERARALALVGAPRAVRRLRALCASEPDEGPPISGDLLRAMRLRRGLSLEAAASLVSVCPSTLSRWERAEAWPEAARLQALSYALGAQAEEAAALSAGLSLGGEPAESEEALEHERERLRVRVWDAEYALMDLRFLALETRLWPLARGSRSGREILSLTYAHHAQWLTLWGREAEGERYAHRAIELQHPEKPHRDVWFWAVHVVANRAVGEGSRRDPRRKARVLEDWLPLTSHWPRIESWFRLNLATAIAASGEMDASLRMHHQALELDRRSGGTERHTSLGLGDTLLTAGRAEEALSYLPPVEGTLPIQRVTEHLTWARALLAIGERSAAHDHLSRAYAEIAPGGAPESCRARVDRVARQLQRSS